jgi:hypothetical protein
MKIRDDFVRDNNRITILSNGGEPISIPGHWRPILDGCDMLIVIPDMHMFYYSSPLDRFRFGASAMLEFLAYLQSLRQYLSASGGRLRIYQLGDLYELRYPSPRTRLNITPREIRLSHPVYDSIASRLHALDACIIYGNHDYEQRRRSGALFNAFEGKVYLEHGYAAEPWYRFSNPHKLLWGLSMRLLFAYRQLQLIFGTLRDRLRPDSRRNLHADEVAAEGVHTGLVDISNYPQTNLKYYRRLISRLGKTDRPPRLCIVSHTHRAYIDPAFAGGNAMYVDAGAWTDGHSEFVVITNEELAICRYDQIGLASIRQTHREAV